MQDGSYKKLSFILSTSPMWDRYISNDMPDPFSVSVNVVKGAWRCILLGILVIMLLVSWIDAFLLIICFSCSI